MSKESHVLDGYRFGMRTRIQSEMDPNGALCKWFEERTAGARGRVRRVMIVALARKLLIALWRFCETGLVPTGARCA